MASGTWYIKQGDRLPVLQATLLDGNDNPVNLTGATVTFTMVNSAGSVTINDQSCTVTNATGGVVQYAWQSGDTSTVGTYSAEFEVTIGGLLERFPNDGNFTVVITAKLG